MLRRRLITLAGAAILAGCVHSSETGPDKELDRLKIDLVVVKDQSVDGTIEILKLELTITNPYSSSLCIRSWDLEINSRNFIFHGEKRNPLYRGIGADPPSNAAVEFTYDNFYLILPRGTMEKNIDVQDDYVFDSPNPKYKVWLDTFAYLCSEMEKWDHMDFGEEAPGALKLYSDKVEFEN